MSTLSKKLFISVLTLVLTVGAFTATTFAWFTLGNKATVGQFQSEVQAGEGLEISFENSNEWFNAISTQKMQEYINAKYSNGLVLKALTSEDGKSFNSIAFNESGQSTATTAASGDYISFTLKFRSLEAAQIVWDTVELGGDQGSFTADLPFHYNGAKALNDVTTVYAKNAARVSAIATATGSTDEKVLVYENGAVDGNIILGETPQSTGAHDYFVRKGNNMFGTSFTNQSNANALTIDFSSVEVINTIQTLSATEVMMTLGKVDAETYYTGSITFNIWIEGWDSDAFNAIFNLPLTVKLGFSNIA